MGGAAAIPLGAIDAVIFDMDGVVTDTARVHAAAWEELFDAYLAERAPGSAPFSDHDYRRYVDGKPRYEGVRSFLASRGITLPDGDPSDPPDRETVCGLGNRKDAAFLDRLHRDGADPYDSTIALVRTMRARGIRTAVISASRNMKEVLASAGVGPLFDAAVDGVEAERLGLPGKPDPAVFLEAARRLGVPPARAAVVEDALAGVEAGRSGGFGLVIGVDRTGHADDLRAAGADIVVADLTEIGLGTSVRDLPSALGHLEDIEATLRAKRPAVFLDYDGTLTPIVEHPADAVLSEAMREAVRALAQQCTVAIVSGRDLDDVRAMVGIDGIWFAGSHGFDIAGPAGERHARGSEFLSALDDAERSLAEPVGAIPGARVERKRFAIAVHFRQTEPALVPAVEAAVDAVVTTRPELRKTGGKMIFELRPAIPWDKGRALLWLLEVLGLDGPDAIPMYVGDDETDEDAFRVLAERGIGVLVRGEGDDRLTTARFTLTSTEDVRTLLERLAGMVEAGTWTPGR
jgi:alpha,alpha-trehalase